MLKKSQIDEKIQCWRFMDCLKTHCRTWLDFTAARSEKTPLLMATLVTQMNQNTQLWRAERLNGDDVASETTRHWKESKTIKYTNHCSSTHPCPKCCLIFIDPSRVQCHRNMHMKNTDQYLWVILTKPEMPPWRCENPSGCPARHVYFPYLCTLLPSLFLHLSG